jgi:hypothetical protein
MTRHIEAVIQARILRSLCDGMMPYFAVLNEGPVQD